MEKEDNAAAPAAGQTGRKREDDTTRSSRRRLLCGFAAGFSLLAGCSALTGDDSTDTASPTPQPSTTTAGRATETATQTATPTETTTPTATPDSTPTPAGTATSAGLATSSDISSPTPSGGGISITPDDLTTFTDPRIGYTIKYPSEWSPVVPSVATPSWVSIEASSDKYDLFSGINIYGYSDFDFSSPTFDSFAAWFAGKWSYDELTVNRRRTITLPKGNKARVLYARARVSGVQRLRLTWLFTIVNGTGYAIQVRFPDKAYTPTLRRTVDAIVESFTIKTNSS